MAEQSVDTKTLIARTQLQAGAAPRQMGPLIETHFNRAAALRKAVIEEKWSDVRERSADCLGLGYAAFRLLEGGEAVSADARKAEEAARQSLANKLRALARHPQRAAAIQELRKQLAGRRAQWPTDWEESLRLLERGKTTGVPLLRALSERRLVLADPGASQAAETAIMVLSRGLLGLVHAEFNQAFQALQPKAEALINADLQAGLKTLVDAFGAGLRAHQQKLHRALAAARAPDETARLAAALSGFVEAQLPRFARAQAHAGVATRRLRRQGAGRAANELGRVAMEAGALTRQALASHAAGYRLALELSRAIPHEELKQVIAKANALGFESPLPKGTPTSLGRLSAAKDGTFLEVEGFITAVHAGKSSDAKLLVRIELIDPASKARGNAVAVFVHLAHLGITRGAYCRLSGKYRRSSSLCDGKPAVEIDALSLAKITKQGWRLAFLESAHPWFRCWPNGLNMLWSLGPHRRARTGEQVSYEGAGELIYPPLVRTEGRRKK